MSLHQILSMPKGYWPTSVHKVFDVLKQAL